MVARSKAWVCGRSLAGIAGSNPTGGMDVCLLWALYIVRYRSPRRADHSSRDCGVSECVRKTSTMRRSWLIRGWRAMGREIVVTLGWLSRFSFWTSYKQPTRCIRFQPDSPRQRPHNLHETYQLPRVQPITPDDGHRKCPKHVEFRDKIKFWILDASCWLFIRRFSRCTVTWT
jgi:hypothetical protein